MKPRLRGLWCMPPVETWIEEYLGHVVRTDGCWIWVGGRYGKVVGYGNFKQVYAHRVAWELANGPIPGRLLVCHTCDVRRRVNPNHLFLGTHRDNMDDMVRKDRHPKGNWLTGLRWADGRTRSVDDMAESRALYQTTHRVPAFVVKVGREWVPAEVVWVDPDGTHGMRLKDGELVQIGDQRRIRVAHS